MGRGRQKAKQQKIARKLKYMTTDTDYDELAKELGAHEPGVGSFDPFADVEEKYAHDADYQEDVEGESTESTEPHKPIPMPVPGAFKHSDTDHKQ